MKKNDQKTAVIHKTVQLTIQQWGNSLAVRIPKAIARSAHFMVGQTVEVIAQEVGISVVPVGQRRLTLEERLAHFDPSKHSGEVLISGRVGAEVY